jgi:hypothetical protein
MNDGERHKPILIYSHSIVNRNVKVAVDYWP